MAFAFQKCFDTTECIGGKSNSYSNDLWKFNIGSLN